MRTILINGNPPTEYLSTGEVARLFSVDPKTVARWAKVGKVTSIRTPGGHRRYPADQFAAHLSTPGDTQPEQAVYPAPGSAIPDQPGFVVGECTHRLAASEWRAGFRTCERCPQQQPAEEFVPEDHGICSGCGADLPGECQGHCDADVPAEVTL